MIKVRVKSQARSVTTAYDNNITFLEKLKELLINYQNSQSFVN